MFGAGFQGTSFGAAPSTTNAFGAASNPFGAAPSTTNAFGASAPTTFGAPATTTPAFGAPAATGFGATAAPSFGASAFGATSTTPAFGAPAPTPAFGAPATTPAFGAPSATPAFGAPAATTFGAPSTTPAFGAPAPTTSAFGATPLTTTAPAFGATPSTPAFGAASSTPGFGFSTAPTTTSTPAFGAPTSTSFGGATNPFGSLSTPSFGPSTLSTTPAFSTSSFSTSSTIPSFSLTTPFSATTAPTTLQPALAPKPAEPNPIQKLQAIINCLKTLNRFFYNSSAPRNPGEAPPGYQNDPAWNRAVMDNPDPPRLVPVPIIGFEGLKQRIELQDKTTTEHEQALDIARKSLDKISKELQSNTKDKLEEYRRRNVELKRKILDIMIKLEKLRSKGYPILAEEDHFRARLENLRRELNQPTQYNGRLKELISMVRMQDDNASRGDQSIDSDDVTQIMKYLNEQKEGIILLAEVLKKDSQDLEVMITEYEKEQQS